MQTNTDPRPPARYTWVVTRDVAVGDSSDAVGRVGPSGTSNRVRFDIVIAKGRRFRMRNEHGAVVFVGYIIGEYQGLEPLDDYGRANGCTDIEYERNDGTWAPV